MRKSIFLRFFIFYLSILFIIACTRKTTNEENVTTEGIQNENVSVNKSFFYCSESSPSSFNPQLESDGASFAIADHIYSRLFDFEYGTTNVVSSLVEKWEVDDQG